MSRADPLRIADYLRHILEAIDNIQAYTAGSDLAGFIADRKTQDAVIRNLEVIGEACNNVAKNHPSFTAQHATVPWGFAMRWPMDTSTWTCPLSGKPSKVICQRSRRRSQRWSEFATLLVAARAHSTRASGQFNY